MMKRGLLITSALLALPACSNERALPIPEALVGETFQSARTAAVSVETLDTAELTAMLARGDVVLVDVRTPEEFGAGRLPGALNAPVETFDAASIPIEETRETILYCRSARRSEHAAQMLAEHTGGTVRHLAGGIIAWEEADGDVIGVTDSE